MKDNDRSLLPIALQHHQRGQLQEAEQIYRQILQANPNQPDALHLLGVIAYQVGSHDVALELIGRAIQLKGTVAEYHQNLGEVNSALRKFPIAISCYRRAIKLNRDYSEAHNGLGNALREQGNLDDSVASCQQAISLRPDYAEAHNNLGNALKDRGQLDEAMTCYQRAMALKPAAPVIHNNLGNLLKTRGKLDEAVECYRRALELKPDFVEAFNNLGIVLNDQGKRDEAVVCFLRALALRPRYAEAHSNLGDVLNLLGNREEAVACCRQALELKPDYAEAHNNLGNALKNMGKLNEAVACYRRALELFPEFVSAYNNLGNVLTELGNHDEAITSYRQALKRNPGFAEAHSNLLVALQYSAGITLAALADAHSEYDRMHAAAVQKEHVIAPKCGQRDHTRRLRLGFVSADLRRHPVGFFLVSVLENFCTDQIENFCYFDGTVRDDMTQRFQSAATQWREVDGLSDERLTGLIKADEIDILFDLAGHTAHNRMRVFSRKPAPIQVTWAGYVGTTGLRAMDYILADRFEIPAEAEPYYREKVLRMPDGYVCYEPPDYAPAVTSLPARKTGHVTFGCFNNPSKITSIAIDVWSKIMERIPHARLAFKYRGWDDVEVSGRVSAQFATKIDPTRLEFLGYSPHAELFAEYNRIDVALDPYPYSGGLTTCESLWMGVPVITCPGETFASRHSLSHLSNVGLTETIARDLDEYVDIAVKLASDLPRLSVLRQSLRERMADSPLCDGKRFAKNLTSLLRGIVEQEC